MHRPITKPEIVRLAPILVVDDNPGCGLLARGLVTQAGVPNPVIVVPGGAPAIEFLRACANDPSEKCRGIPALVLLDLNMPGMSGLDVLQWIREHAALKHVSVIMWSASLDNDEVDAATSGGADHVLSKLAEPRVLRERIQAALHRANGEHETPPGASAAADGSEPAGIQEAGESSGGRTDARRRRYRLDRSNLRRASASIVSGVQRWFRRSKS